MASVDTAAPRGGHKKGKKKKMRRLGIRMDMTPMVDVAFLLLTFFIYTTSMNRPQTMEINIPPTKGVNVEVACSNLMTIRVKEDGAIFWNICTDDPKKVDMKELHNLLVQQNQQNPKLITLLKVDRKGKYSMMVNLLDEFNVANVTRFSLAPMEEADKRILAKAAG
jgi:biopolymer transport protein ExbD